jgi:hypothetical protein
VTHKKTSKPQPELAAYIIDWLCQRNGGELQPAIEAMTVFDHRLMHEELTFILQHGGRPPNWVKP